GRLEATQSAGYDPPGLCAAGPRLPTPTDATAAVLLLPWPVLRSAGRGAAAIDLRPGRQEDEADAERRVGDHPGTFARRRGRVDPEHDFVLMTGNPMSAARGQHMDSLRKAEFPTPSSFELSGRSSGPPKLTR